MSSYGPPGQRREDPFIELRGPLRLLSRSSSLILFTHPPLNRKEPEIKRKKMHPAQSAIVVLVFLFTEKHKAAIFH